MTDSRVHLMNNANDSRLCKGIQYFFYFLVGLYSPFILFTISLLINTWIPFLSIGFAYLLLIVFAYVILIKIFNIKAKSNLIRTFIYSFIVPLLIWLVLSVLMMLSWVITPDTTGGCNPPGPDGPNCHLCPKGTRGCGDVYKKD